jgi:NADPH:quinone reductase-like Zn-dependent oxidoreductase
VRVALARQRGGFAELALAPADRLAPMPGRASFAEAAGLVIGGGTAYQGLVDRGRLQAGQTRDQAIGAVRDGGRVISIILHGLPAQLERGITGESFAAHGGRERLEALSRLVDAGTLRPQVEAVLPLDQARQALTRVAGRHTRGKIVLQIRP